MKLKAIKSVLLLFSMLCIFCLPVQVSAETPQGTNGDELQVMKAEQLEIQFGADWAGVEFQLKTDAGVYPGTVAVGTDGVLRLEIGGSSKYILTCMNSSVAPPTADEMDASSGSTQAPATTESETQESEGNSSSAPEQKGTTSGIPIAHLVIFIGGMAVAIGTLVVLHILKKKREIDTPCDDDEDE